MRRKTSSIWYHFNPKGKTIGECMYCKALLSFTGGSINNLKRHLRNKHIAVAIKSNFASATSGGNCQDYSKNSLISAGSSKATCLQKKPRKVGVESDKESMLSDEESSLPSTQKGCENASYDKLRTPEELFKQTLSQKHDTEADTSNAESVSSGEGLSSTQADSQECNYALLGTSGGFMKKRFRNEKKMVWYHFNRKEDGKRKCKYCNASFSIAKDSISNLRSHLKKKHPKVTIKSDVDSASSDGESSSSPTMTDCQGDVSASLETADCSVKECLKKINTVLPDKRDVESVSIDKETDISSTHSNSQENENTLLDIPEGFMKKSLTKKPPENAFESNPSQNDSSLTKLSTSRKSILRNHFCKIKDGKGECKYCNTKINIRGSISNLKRHFQRKHPTVILKSSVDSAASKEESSLSPTKIDCHEDVSASLSTAEGKTKASIGYSNSNLKRHLQNEHPVITIKNNYGSVISKIKSKSSPLWYHFKKKDGKGECKYCYALISISGGSINNLKKHLKRKHPKVTVERDVFLASSERASCSSTTQTGFQEENHAALNTTEGSLKEHLDIANESDAKQRKADVDIVENAGTDEEASLPTSQSDSQGNNNAMMLSISGLNNSIKEQTKEADESYVESVTCGGETCLPITQTDYLQDSNVLLSTEGDSMEKKLLEKLATESNESNIESESPRMELCFPSAQSTNKVYIKVLLKADRGSVEKALGNECPTEYFESDVESVASVEEPCSPRTNISKNSFVWCHFNKKEDSQGECKYCCVLLRGSIMTLKRHLQRKHPTVTIESNLTIDSCKSKKPSSRSSPLWYHFNKKEGGKCECKYCFALFRVSGNSISNLKRHLVRKHPTIAIANNEEMTASGMESGLSPSKSDFQCDNALLSSDGAFMKRKKTINGSIELCSPKTSTSKRSLIWEHFNVLGDNKSECKYCNALLSTAGGSINNLKRHLQRKHLRIAVKSKYASLTPANESVLPTLSNSLWDHFNEKENNICECKYCNALLSFAGNKICNLRSHLRKKHPAVVVESNTSSEVPAKESNLSTITSSSYVWRHFSKKREGYAESNHCNGWLSFSGGSTSNLKRHLQKKHPEMGIKNNYASVTSKIKSKPSPLWYHFKKKDGKGECKYCYALISISAGSISNLKRHLQKKHPNVTVKSIMDEASSDGESWSSTAQTGFQEDNHALLNTEQSKVAVEIVVESAGTEEEACLSTLLTDSEGNSNAMMLSTSCVESVTSVGETCLPITHLQKQRPTVLLDNNVESLSLGRSWSVRSPENDKELEDNNISVSNQELKFFTHQRGISNSEISHSQISLKRSLPTTKPPIDKKVNMFNLQLLKMICKEFNSFRVVEDPEFRKFVSLLCPGYQLPNRKTLSQTILPQVYQELVVKIKQQLSVATGVALTTQGWTSVCNQCYIVITAHYFSESTTMCSNVLGSIEYNQNTFSEMLMKFCKDWEINFKISAIVTDNNSDIVPAIKQCQWKHISCFGNFINAVLKSGLKPAEQIIKKIKRLLQYFKKNPEAVSTLHDIQKQMGLPLMKFKQDVSTRGDSTYYMLSNVISNQTVIMSTLAVLGNVQVDISQDEWDVCQHMITLLEIFEEVVNEINSDKSVSLSETVVINMNLLDFLVNYKQTQNLPELVIELCNILEKEINNILHHADDNVELKLEAALLDPRFKQNAFENDKAMYNQVYKSLITQIQMLIISEPDLSPSHTLGSLWSDFDNEVAAYNRLHKPRSSSILELDNYLAESTLPRICDPMAWWNERKLAYPNLYKIVLKKHCIPASLIPSKRIFSNSSHILKEKQSGLGSSKVNKIVFLNCNL